MPISIVTINGHSPYIDYETFERDINTTFSNVESKFFIYNNFPVGLSHGDDFDVLLIIGVQNKTGNYYRLKSDTRGRTVYLHNQIIPIKFIREYEDDDIVIHNNEIYTDNEVLEFDDLLASYRFGFRDYLIKRSAFMGNRLFINPLIFIQNKKRELCNIEGYIFAEQFTFPTLLKYFKSNPQQIFQAYKPWKDEGSFETIGSDVGRITEQAALDSEMGFLTKRKLDRIAKESLRESNLTEYLGKSLIIINGKAGTGKSSQLMSLTFYALRNELATRYLTYNRLLVYDIAKLVKSYRSSLIAEEKKAKAATVNTLHYFFRRLARTLRVLNVISEPRINEILSGLQDKMRAAFDFLQPFIKANGIEINLLKNRVLNSTLDVSVKDFAINYIEYLKKENIVDGQRFRTASKDYFLKIKSKLTTVNANEVFLVDYYKVLQYILEQITDPGSYYNKHKLRDKLDLLEATEQISDIYKDIENGRRSMSKEGFISFTRRRVTARTRNMLLLVDEAQDCHRLEKDILIELFAAENIVIANGGKEQLIRHVEWCNWEASQGKRYPVRQINKRAKSYRMKRSIVDLCNYVADHFGLALTLETTESTDTGEVILDFRSKSAENTEVVLTQLKDKGVAYGCTLYESLLIILNSSTQRSEFIVGRGEEKIEINEYDNVRMFDERKRGDWTIATGLEEKGFMFWNGTVSDKSKLVVPPPNEIRYIFYESIRGLEAWSVVCYDLDVFFEVKQNEEDAEKFMMNDLLLSANVEKRKKMFATNWILMALTRAMDTLYIHIHNPKSEIGVLLTEYAKFNKQVKVLKD